MNLALKAVKLISKNTINLAESEKASKILMKMLARMKSLLGNNEISTEVKAKDSVFGSLLLTGAVIISEVKLKALPHLTWVIHQIIDGFGQTQSDQMRLILMISLCKILESMSQFISPYLESIIKTLCLFDPRQQTDLGFRVTKTIEIVSQTSSGLSLPAVSNINRQMDILIGPVPEFFINVVILIFRYQQSPNRQQQSAMILSGGKDLCFENNRGSRGKVRRRLPEFIA